MRPERLKATAQRAGSKVSLIIAKVLSPALRLEHEKYYKDSSNAQNLGAPSTIVAEIDSVKHKRRLMF